jgi:tetratricopeptide (TPR) repeat protein
MAANTGRDQAAMWVPLVLAEYLNWRRRFADGIAVAAISLATARNLGNRLCEGDALTMLGNAQVGLRRLGEAITAHQDAATIYRDIADRQSEAMALTNLGCVLAELRRFDEAIAACQDAAAMYRDTGAVGPNRGQPHNQAFPGSPWPASIVTKL